MLLPSNRKTWIYAPGRWNRGLINPRFHLPGAYIQVLRFEGSSMEEVAVDPAEIDGDLRTVLDQVHTRIQALNTVGTELGQGFRDRLLPTYPDWTLRELLHNALIHR